MIEKHYTSQLSAFVDHELPKSEQQEIAEHLMRCVGCRAEHDRIKLGAALAGRLERSDAPKNVWTEITNAIDDKRQPQMSLIPQASYFGFRDLTGYAVAAVLVIGLITVAYFALFRRDADHVRKTPNTQGSAVTEQQQVPDVAAASPKVPANIEPPSSNVVQSYPNSRISDAPQQEIVSRSSFQFETISGTPKVGESSTSDRLTVGDFLETDGSSRARIKVANIGNVEIQPNSRVKLVGTNPNEHRLLLERGVLQAKISAPPRLFIVDTPSAAAVDLGCEYKLEVDKAGDTHLSVTKGFVSLERDGRKSIVPAGAVCITKRGKGLGTPFSSDTDEKFRSALEKFDFARGGSRAVQSMLDSRNFYDMVTLWHLLSRVQKTDREKVYNALSGYVKPPAGVTRDGILSLDKKMLAAWRVEVEKVWFD